MKYFKLIRSGINIDPLLEPKAPLFQAADRVERLPDVSRRSLISWQVRQRAAQGNAFNRRSAIFVPHSGQRP